MPGASSTALVELRQALASQPEFQDAVDAAPAESEGFGDLVAAGPRAASDPAAYAFVVEAIREGYLLHYATPRMLEGADPDLCLLAGDFLYAVGLERLSKLEDVEAVRELAQLIASSAALQASETSTPTSACEALWLAETVAVACGADAELGVAREAILADPEQTGGLVEWARATAGSCGLDRELEGVGDQVGFRK